MNAELLNQRNHAIAAATAVLPGSVPYANIRPINVSERFDGQTLFDAVCQSHPHIGAAQWHEWFAAGDVLRDGQVVGPEQPVRGGQQYQHLFPDTVEPDVDPNIRIIYEDDELVVADKPAPLPMHPSGRFNKNTLISILGYVYLGERLLPAHRLDANTTGVVVLSRTPDAARHLQRQFDGNQVSKSYLARCHGHPAIDSFSCNAMISKQRGPGGLRTTVPKDGQAAQTNIVVLDRIGDGTSLVEARPITGRTNQIRVHLWHQGHAICGDQSYLPDRVLGKSQTRQIDDPPMCLHACEIQFRHPSDNQPISFISENTPATLGWMKQA